MRKTAVLLFVTVVSSTLISTGYDKNSQNTGYSSNVSYKAEEISKSYKEADDFLESLELKTYEEIPDPLTLELVTEIDPYFDPYDLRAKSNLSAEDINKKLEGTGLAGLGESYKEAEELENVNAAFLIALTAWESSWGNKTIAENNISGFQAYDKDPAGNARVFGSKGECVLHTAKYLNIHYLSEDGKYFSRNIYEMNKRYASDTKWAKNITLIAYDMIGE